MRPRAPAQLRTVGSNRDSWYICAVTRRQSSSYIVAYFLTRGSYGESAPTLSDRSSLAAVRICRSLLKYLAFVML